jgi:hypothetical protein
MTEVAVTCINGNWSRTFCVDSFSQLTAKSLRDLCLQSDPTLFSKGNQLFIFNGTIIPSEDVCMCDVVDCAATSVHVFTMLVNESLGIISGFDPQSALSAKQSATSAYSGIDGDDASSNGENVDWKVLASCIPGKLFASNALKVSVVEKLSS